MPSVDRSSNNSYAACYEAVLNKIWSTSERDILSTTREENLSVLKQLLRNLAIDGESTSVLVAGPRGSGKSALVTSALDSLKAENAKLLDNLSVISLNGFLQTDERIALKDIARQVGVQCDMEFDGKMSIADCLTFLLGFLKTGNREETKAAVFVLDEFDLFVNQHNQSLLYNLLDSTLSANTPILVVGLTCRAADCVDLLEKRVKSRFSGRVLCCFNDYDFPEYSSFAKELLLLSRDCGANKTYVQNWNRSVQELLKEPKILDFLKQAFELDKSVAALKRVLGTLLISCPGESLPDVEYFLRSFHNYFDDRLNGLLHNLSMMELVFLVCMSQASALLNNSPVNFEIIFHQYDKFTSKKVSSLQFPKPVLFKIFQRLADQELITPVIGAELGGEGAGGTANARSQLREYQPVILQIEPRRLALFVENMNHCPFTIKELAKSLPML